MTNQRSTIIATLKSVTLPPNIKLHVPEGGMNNLHPDEIDFILTGVWPNSWGKTTIDVQPNHITYRSSDRDIVVQTFKQFTVHVKMPIQTCIDWMYRELQDMWLHELKEWVKIGGAYIDSPHQELDDEGRGVGGFA